MADLPLGAAVLLIAAALLFLFFCVKRQLFRIEPPKSQPKIPLALVVGAFFIFLFQAVLTTPIFWTLTNIRSLTREQAWLLAFFITIALLLCAYLCLIHFCMKRAQKRLWGVPGTRLRAYFTGAVLAVGVIFVAEVTMMCVTYLYSYFIAPSTGEQLVTTQLKIVTHSPLLFSIAFIFTAGVIPMLEEILFRGLLQNMLADYLSPKKAIVIASLIFAGCHYSPSQGAYNAPLLCSLFVTSLFLGIIYMRYNSLWASIGMHGAVNGIMMLVLLAT